MTTFSVLLLRSTVVIVWPSTLPTYLHHDLWHDWSVGPWKRTIFCSSVMLPRSHAARSPGDAGLGGAAKPCVRERSDRAITTSSFGDTDASAHHVEVTRAARPWG